VTDSVSGVAMLAAPSSRSRIYLDLMERDGLLPERVVLLEDPTVETAEQRRRAESERFAIGEFPEDPELDASRTVRQRLEDLHIPYERAPTLDPNNERVVAAVSDLDQDVLVYSGPGGVILDAALLDAGPRFLHVHAGKLPQYRGSTTIYYSLLADGECGVTAFFMNEDIDEGPIVARDTFDPPRRPETIDLYYDSWIRANLLTDVLSTYQNDPPLPELPQRPQNGETYFIVHPVLKHLAMLALEE
jgi:methionyl-tRNA formyltransferase